MEPNEWLCTHHLPEILLSTVCANGILKAVKSSENTHTKKQETPKQSKLYLWCSRTYLWRLEWPSNCRLYLSLLAIEWTGTCRPCKQSYKTAKTGWVKHANGSKFTHCTLNKQIQRSISCVKAPVQICRLFRHQKHAKAPSHIVLSGPNRSRWPNFTSRLTARVQ